MNKSEMMWYVGNRVWVTYNAGGSDRPHNVSQNGTLKHYLDDANPNAKKVCLIVPSKIRDGAEKDKVPYTSCTVLNYEDIVSVEPYVELKGKKA